MTGKKPKIEVVDTTKLFAETQTAHIAPEAERKQIVVRVPDLDSLVAKRNPKWKAYASMFGSKDTSGNVHPNFRDAVLWGIEAPNGPEAAKLANKEGIIAGKAAVGTAGKRPPRDCFWRDRQGKEHPYSSAGGGLEFTNEWLVVLFASSPETLEDFEAQNCPADMVRAELLNKVQRSREDRMRREARDNRATAAQRRPQGKKPEVSYDDEAGDLDV